MENLPSGCEQPSNFDEAYRLYRSLVYRIIGQTLASKRVTYDAAMIDDIGQIVWMKLSQYFNRFDPQRGAKFSTWLGQIAKNATYDYLRAMYRQNRMLSATGDMPDVPDISDTGDPHGVIEAREFLCDLDAQILRLSASLQRTFLAFLEGHSEQEIADRYGLQRNTVYSQRFKAREELRRLLGRHP